MGNPGVKRKPTSSGYGLSPHFDNWFFGAHLLYERIFSASCSQRPLLEGRFRSWNMSSLYFTNKSPELIPSPRNPQQDPQNGPLNLSI